MDRTDHIIGMLLPIIAESFDSFNTLNLLARTNTTLQVATGDHRLVCTVAKKSQPMTKTALRRLFVLPGTVNLSYMFLPSVYTIFRIVPRCRVIDAFQQAMATHGNVQRMAATFHVRQRRSVAMKEVWKRKKELLATQKDARRGEVEQIRSELFIIPCSGHIPIDAESYYELYGVVKRLGRVYRNKRLMALHTAGLLHIEGGDMNTFLRVARVDMTDPRMLTHAENLLILRHNIAWEHYLFNYSNFQTAMISIADVITDIDHIEFLFPLPTRWPWIGGDGTLHSVEQFQATELSELFHHWLAEHDTLYEDPSTRTFHPAQPSSSSAF